MFNAKKAGKLITAGFNYPSELNSGCVIWSNYDLWEK
jgi:hypothetical protein